MRFMQVERKALAGQKTDTSQSVPESKADIQLMQSDAVPGQPGATVRGTGATSAVLIQLLPGQLVNESWALRWNLPESTGVSSSSQEQGRWS